VTAFAPLLGLLEEVPDETVQNLGGPVDLPRRMARRPSKSWGEKSLLLNHRSEQNSTTYSMHEPSVNAICRESALRPAIVQQAPNQTVCR
jgi:hypothetical protein